jgi:malate synthase
VKAGHDGTWVAHPGLVPVAKQIFDEYMKTPNQIARKREEVRVTPQDLLAVPEGAITEQGLRLNVDVGIQYLESWLGGNGCVPIYNLMEDAATAEISRAQVWQWVRHGAKLSDGRPVNASLVKQTIREQLGKFRRYPGDHYEQAAKLFEDMMTRGEFPEFLTLAAYEFL